jgi:hypothetical protein
MKAKELLELLQKCDPEEDVSFQMISGCCGEHEYMEVVDAEVFDMRDDKYPKWLIIEFAPLPGYRSCIQAGGTIRAHAEYWERFGKNPDGTPLDKKPKE